MPYVVTQSCCADASCVLACPVNCIHPAPGEPGFGETEMLYVDPRTCVDCGACATACPVDAVKPHTALTGAELPFLAINADYFAAEPHADRTPMAVVEPTRQVAGAAGTRVAIVGAGPAALYAADELLRQPDLRVDVFDRLPTPYGLVRAGVAPDHQDTKRVTELFAKIESNPRFRYRLNVEVGRHLDHDELRAHYHAVVYAVGAATDRSLGIPGEQLPGSTSATAVVGWYNGHPDHQDAYVDLGGDRVVVVGNGNVALDVARVLTADPARLAGTDIAELPLATLRGSNVAEVVVLGRRGPLEAAFTLPELVGLAALDDVDVIVDNGGEPLPDVDARTRLLSDLAGRTPVPGRRRIVLRFRAAPVRVHGSGHVTGLEVERTSLVADEEGSVRPVGTGETETIDACMVLRSVGYHGRPVPGLPFDDASGTVPHEGGRVEPGVYVAGWIKRGPRGFIGTNKSCAAETVAALLDDLDAGRLAEPAEGVEAVDALLRQRQPHLVDLEGWRAIDRRERSLGRDAGRPRAKLVDPDALLHAAAAAEPAAELPAPTRSVGARRRHLLNARR